MKQSGMASAVAIFASIMIFAAAIVPGTSRASGESDAIKELREEMRLLRDEMAARQKAYEARIEKLQNDMETLSRQQADDSAPGKGGVESSEHEGDGESPSPDKNESAWSSVTQAAAEYSLGFELVLDTNYYREDSEAEVAEMMAMMPGFTSGIIDPHGEEHHGLEEGFNLREVELGVSGEVPGYFKARVLFAFFEEGAELEEAVVETTGLPAGFTIMGGKFLSQFGYINRLHPHDWDFVDRPLIYELALGDHGLLEKGVQFAWQAPTPFGLRFGLEALQGENEGMFNYIDGDELPDKAGPRLWVGWVKSAFALAPNHNLQLGMFGAGGRHQELRDYSGNGARDASLDGNSWFFGGDAVYAYEADRPHGQGDFELIGEYFNRKKDLEVSSSALMPNLVGGDQVDRQDGYYVQAVYGFLPRWRAGLRWDQVGLSNKSRFPDGHTETYGSSYSLAGMVDWSPADSSYLRFQGSRGKLALEAGDEAYWQFFTQLVVTLGAGGH
ncbi:MAG: zinc-regulated TonB-dependent outer membrane receptor [Deltaproteobacteria bacterium]|nr:zinc-regulated TonB-dependent outer membrane receptor [Deltaproteobacteria bacterium]